MKAKIYIKYKDGILDPQGKVTGNALNSIGINGFDTLTIGKYVEMNFENVNKEDAIALVDQSCKKLLVNPNTQTYTFEIEND